MSLNTRRIGVAVGIVIVMVLSAAPGLVRAFPTPPTALANASAATTEATAVGPGVSITFSSGSTPGAGGTLTYTWYFGDLTPSASTASVNHPFTADGIYDVTLVVQESTGMMALDTVRIYIISPEYGAGGVTGAVIRASPSILGTVTEDTTITFDCLTSWPAGYDTSLLSCSWDFGDDGTATTRTASHTYAYKGTYTVRLVVRDPAGNADTATATVTVVNQTPVAPATAFTWTPTSPNEDTAVIFDAADGWDTPTDTLFLAYAWDFGDGGRGSGDQAPHTYNGPGTYPVGLTVTDDNGIAAPLATRQVTIGNAAPTASASVANTPVNEAETVQFIGTASTDTASDAGALTYAWTGGLTGSRPTKVWYDEGSPSTTLTVTDAHSATATATPAITVNNRAPFPSIVSAIKVSGTTVKVKAIVHEVGADSFTLTYDWGHGTPHETSTATFTNSAGTSPYRQPWEPSHTFPSSTTWYTVILTATDNDGASATATASVKGGGTGTLIDNKAPEVTAVNVDLTSKAEDVAFSFTGAYTDPDGTAPSFSWEFGDHNSATTSTTTTTHAYARAGTYTVILKVTDAGTDSGANSRQVTVTNTAPTGVSFTKSPASPFEDDAVTFTASATDTASDVAALRYAWDFGDGGRGSGATASHTYRTPGTRTVMLTVRDDNAASTTYSLSVTATNKVPVAGFTVYATTSGNGAAIAAGTPPSPPANPKEQHLALFSAITSYDGPSDDALLTYSWVFGDGGTGTGLNVMHKYATQGTYYARLTITDNHGASDSEPDAVSGTPITVTDTAPVASVGPDRNTYGGGSVHIRATAEDDDAEPLTYAWDMGVPCLPPTPCPAGPDAWWTYTATGTYTVTLTVTDASGSSGTDSLTVTVNRDSDGDQLEDGYEMAHLLDPYDPDTDGDFLLDNVEALYGTDPTTDDYDNDGLNDWEELFVGDDGHITLPLNPDTDGDSLGDGMEDGLFDPVTQGWTHDTVLNKVDKEWDGYPHGGVVYGPDSDQGATTTSPSDPDTDNDGLPDGWIDGANGNPDDGIKEVGEFEDRDLNGRVTLGAWNGGGGLGETDPNTVDTDLDGVADSVEEGIAGIDMNTATVTNPLDDDTDNDGLLDGTEDENHDGARQGDDPTNGWSDWQVGAPAETDPLVADTDGDGLTDGLELGFETPEGFGTQSPWGTALGYGPDLDPDSTTDPLSRDTDRDQIPDGWIDSGTNPGVRDPLEGEDRNGNGLRDGNSPYDTTSDWGTGGETDPAYRDTDRDILTDHDELTVYSTNPLSPDTDMDRLPDSLELGRGLDFDPMTTTNVLDADSDNDGLLDGIEDSDLDGYRTGNSPADTTSDWNGGRGPGERNPLVGDTDGDGLSDGLEVGLTAPQGTGTDLPWGTAGYGPDADPATITDPLDIDSDDDGISDGWIDTATNPGVRDPVEGEDRNGNGAREGTLISEVTCGVSQPSGWSSGGETDPTQWDTDRDGLGDFDEVSVLYTDPLSVDTDGDCLLDGWETLFPRFDPTVWDNRLADPDSDGLSDEDEMIAGTDPDQADTDLDFFPDGSDSDPTTFNIRNVAEDVIMPDVVIRDDQLGVRLAIEFSLLTDAVPTLSEDSLAGDGDLNARVGSKVSIGFSETPPTFRAVLKVQYDGDAPLDSDGYNAQEKRLRMYQYLGVLDSVPEWTLLVRSALGERTGVEPSFNHVWGVFHQASTFALADTTQNDQDGDVGVSGGGTDGEELDVDLYDPVINEWCEYTSDPCNPMAEWRVDLASGGAATTRYAKIPVTAGSLEDIYISTTSSPGSSPCGGPGVTATPRFCQGSLVANIPVDVGGALESVSLFDWDLPRIASTGADLTVLYATSTVWIGEADVVFSRSIDGGRTWIPSPVPVSLDIGGDRCDESPDITADESGNAFIVWEADYPYAPPVNCVLYAPYPSHLVYFQKRLVNNLDAPSPVEVAIDPYSSDQTDPAVAVDSSGNAYVVWVDDRANTGGDIRISKSVDGGLTFGASGQVHPNEGVSHGWPSVHVDTSGAVLVAYVKDGHEIILARSTDGGVNFVLTSVSATDSLSRGQPVVAFAPQSAEVFVAWSQGNSPDQDVVVRRSTNGGQIFSETVRTASDAPSGSAQLNPTLGFDVHGHLHVAWQDNRNTAWDIRMATAEDYAVGGFGPSQSLVSPGATGDQIAPSLVAGNGVRTVWLDQRDAPYTNTYDIVSAVLSGGLSLSVGASSSSIWSDGGEFRHHRVINDDTTSPALSAGIHSTLVASQSVFDPVTGRYVAPEGFVYVPFRWSSSLAGRVWIGDLYFETNAVPSVDSQLLEQDTDGDGLSDAIELYLFGSAVQTDFDGDGLNSGPTDRDSDGDGLTDGEEVRVFGSALLDRDTEGDGLWDGWRDVGSDGLGPGDSGYPGADPDGTQGNGLLDDGEDPGEKIYGTDPLRANSDGDGLDDSEEVAWFGGAVGDVRYSGPDSDGDGLWDGPQDPDTDGDGIQDDGEILNFQTDPLSPDTDDDGLSDNAEVSVPSSISFDFTAVMPERRSTDGFRALQGAWELQSSLSHSAGFAWEGHSTGSVVTPSALMTPQVDFGSVKDATISLFYSLQIAGTGSASVIIGDDEGAGCYVTASLPPTAVGVWAAHTAVVPPCPSDEERISFSLSTDSAADLLFVDDVTITAKTDPLLDDTDGDGLLDGEEVTVWGSSPLVADTDGDSYPDLMDARLDRDDHAPELLEYASADFRFGFDLRVRDEASGIRFFLTPGNESPVCRERTYEGYGITGNGFVDDGDIQAPRTFSYVALGDDWYRLSWWWGNPVDNPGWSGEDRTYAVYVCDGYDNFVRLELRIAHVYSGQASGLISSGTLDFGAYENVAIAIPLAGLVPSLVTMGSAILAFIEGQIVIFSAGVVLAAIFGFVIIGSYSCNCPSVPYLETRPIEVGIEATLATFVVGSAKVFLTPGFVATAGSFSRGYGWEYIHHTLPSLTQAHLEEIVETGVHTLSGIYDLYAKALTIGGITATYTVWVLAGIVIFVSETETIVDVTGRNVILDYNRWLAHIWNEHAVAWATITAALRSPNPSSIEIWQRTQIMFPWQAGERMFVYSVVDGIPLAIFTRPLPGDPTTDDVRTAFYPGLDLPGVDVGWPGICGRVVPGYPERRYELHLFGNILDPTKPYVIVGSRAIGVC